MSSSPVVRDVVLMDTVDGWKVVTRYKGDSKDVVSYSGSTRSVTEPVARSIAYLNDVPFIVDTLAGQRKRVVDVALIELSDGCWRSVKRYGGTGGDVWYSGERHLAERQARSMAIADGVPLVVVTLREQRLATLPARLIELKEQAQRILDTWPEGAIGSAWLEEAIRLIEQAIRLIEHCEVEYPR